MSKKETQSMPNGTAANDRDSKPANIERVFLERLEDRILLSHVSTLVDGLLTVNDIPENTAADEILITFADENTLRVTVDSHAGEDLWAFADVDEILIIGGDGHDRIVLHPQLNRPTEIRGDAGNDRFVIQDGPTASTVTYTATGTASGSVDRDGSLLTYQDLEIVVDRSAADNRIYHFLTGTPQTIRFTDHQSSDDGVSKIDSNGTGDFALHVLGLPTISLTINGGSDADTFTVGSLDTTFDADIVLDGADGADRYEIDLADLPTPLSIAVADSSADGSADHLTLLGSSGTDNLTVDTFAITQAGADPVTIGYSGLELVDILGGEGNDQLQVTATGQTPVTFDGQDGDDTTTVTLDALTSNLTIQDSGASGSDSLIAIGSAAADQINIDASSISLLGSANLLYSGIEALRVNAGADNDSITAIASPNTQYTIRGQGGTDQLIVDAQGLDADASGTNPVTISVNGMEPIEVPQGMEKILLHHTPFEVDPVALDAGLADLVTRAAEIAAYGEFARQLPFAGTPEVQTISINGATQGSYTLSIQGQTTGPIAHDANAEAVRDAIAQLRGFGDIEVVTDPNAGNPIHTLTFRRIPIDIPQLNATPNANFDGTIEMDTLGDGGQTYGDLLNPAAIFEQLRTELADYFLAGGSTNSEDVLNFLRNTFVGVISFPQATMLGDITITINDGDLLSGKLVNNGIARPFLDLSLTTTRTSTVWLSEAQNLASQNLFFLPPASPGDMGGSLSLTTGFDAIKLAVGAGSGAFFIDVHDITAGGSASETSRQGQLDIGVVNTTVAAGSIDLSIDHASILFNDPAGNGDVIFRVELLDSDLDQLITIDAVGSVDGQLPVAINPAFDPIGGELGDTILIGGVNEDFFSFTTDPHITIPSGLRPFTTITAAEMLRPLVRFATWLDQIGQSTILDPNVWLINNTTLRDLFTTGALSEDDVQNGIQSLGRTLREQLTNALQTHVTIEFSEGVEEQTITISDSPTTGTFSLTYNGQTTGQISLYDSNGDFALTDLVIQNALRALPDAGLEQVTVNATAGRSPNLSFIVRFNGVESDPQELTIQTSPEFDGQIQIETTRQAGTIVLPSGLPSFSTVQQLVAAADANDLITITPVYTRATKELTLRVSLNIANLNEGRETFITPLSLNLEHVIGAVTDVQIQEIEGRSRIVITSLGHGLSSGQRVLIANAKGIEAANGQFTIELIDADTFFLRDGQPATAIVGDVHEATNDAPITVRVQGHGLETGDSVRITGVEGNQAANGSFTVTIINQNLFSLDGSDGSASGQYTGGGSVQILYTGGGVLSINPLDPLFELKNYFIGNVTDASAGANNWIQVTASDHQLVDGQRVTITDVRGLNNANGTFTIQLVDADTFLLVDTTVDGAYTGGGKIELDSGDLLSRSNTINNVTVTPGLAIDFTYGVDFTPKFISDADRARIVTPANSALSQTGRLDVEARLWIQFNTDPAAQVIISPFTPDPGGADDPLVQLAAHIRLAITSALGADHIAVTVGSSDGFGLRFSAANAGNTFRVFVDDPDDAAADILGLNRGELAIIATGDMADPQSFLTDTAFDLILGSVERGDQRLVQVVIPGRPEIQSFKVRATGGTFSLAFDGERTRDLNYNVDAITVQTSLREDIAALANIIVESDNADPAGDGHTFTLTFQNFAADPSQLTSDSTGLLGDAGTPDEPADDIFAAVTNATQTHARPQSPTTFLTELNELLRAASNQFNPDPDSPIIVAELRPVDDEAEGFVDRLTFVSRFEISARFAGSSAADLGFDGDTDTLPDAAESYEAPSYLATPATGAIANELSLVLKIDEANLLAPPANPGTVLVPITIAAGDYDGFNGQTEVNGLIAKINEQLARALTAAGFAADLITADADQNRLSLTLSDTADDPYFRLLIPELPSGEPNAAEAEFGLVTGQIGHATRLAADGDSPFYFVAPDENDPKHAVTIQATIDLSMDDPAATALYGFLELDISRTLLAGTMTLTTLLRDGDANPNDNKISIEDLVVTDEDGIKGGVINGQTEISLAGRRPDGRLSADASLLISLNGETPVEVIIRKLNTDPNEFDYEIVDDINTALSRAGLGTDIIASLNASNHLTLSVINPGDTITLDVDESFQGNPSIEELSFEDVTTPTDVITASSPIALIIRGGLGRLAEDATFLMALNDEPLRTVTLLASDTAQNETIDNLVNDLDNALFRAGLSDHVFASLTETDSGELTLTLTARYGNTARIEVAPADPAATELGLATTQSDLPVVTTPIYGGSLLGSDNQLELDLTGTIAGRDNIFNISIALSNLTDPTSTTVSLVTDSPLLASRVSFDQTLAALQDAGAFLSLVQDNGQSRLEVQTIEVIDATGGTYQLAWRRADDAAPRGDLTPRPTLFLSQDIAHNATATSPGSGAITVEQALRDMQNSEGDLAPLDRVVVETESFPESLMHTVRFEGFSGDPAQLESDITNLNPDGLANVLHRTENALDSLPKNLLLTDIPLVGISANDSNDYGSGFAQIIAEIASERPDTLQEFEQAVRQRLGLEPDDPGTPDGARFSFIFSGNALGMDLGLSQSVTTPVPFNIDIYSLAELSQLGVPDQLDDDKASIFDQDGSVRFDVLSTAIADIDLSIDFSQDSDPDSGIHRALLDNDSSVAISLSSELIDLDTDGYYGSEELYIADTFISLFGSDGDATFTVGLDADQPVAAGEYDNENLLVAVEGSVNADMRLFSQDLSPQAGNISIRIADIEAALRNEDESVFLGPVDSDGEFAGPDLASLTAPGENRLAQLLHDPNTLITGLDRFFYGIQRSIELAMVGSNLPLIGDAIRDGLDPFYDSIVETRRNVNDFLTARLNASGEGDDPIDIIQFALYEAFGPQALNLLKDSAADVELEVGPEDIVFSSGGDGEADEWNQWDMHIGQQYTISLPFELGLNIGSTDFADVLPDFGFTVDASEGVQFTFAWDLRLGFGVSLDDGFYLNAGATVDGTSNSPIEELKAIASATIPGLSAGIALGLVQGEFTDGTTESRKISGPRGLRMNLFQPTDFSNSFTLAIRGMDPDNPDRLEEFDIDYDPGHRERFDEFLTNLNIEIERALPNRAGTPPIIVLPDFSRFASDPFEFDVPGPSTPSLVINARQGDITEMTISFDNEEDAQRWGFFEVQHEDLRSRGLGFENEASAIFDNNRFILEAPLEAPANGRFLEDIEFDINIDIAGESEPVTIGIKLLEALSEHRQIEALEHDPDDPFKSNLQDILQASIEAAMFRAGFAPGSLNVDVVDGKFVFSMDELTMFDGSERTVEDFNISYSELEETELKLAFSLDIKDPNYEPGDYDPEDPSTYNRLSLSEIAEADDKLEIFEPKLRGDASIRMHVEANSDHITGFIEQSVGLGDGALGLPSVSFDFKVDAYAQLAPADSSDPNDEAFKYGIDLLAFDNVSLDLGGLLGTIAKPVINAVGGALQPILAITGDGLGSAQGFLNQPLPLLDELGFDVSILDLSGNKASFNQFMNAVQAIVATTEGITQFLADYEEGDRFNFGCFLLDMDPDSPLYFPRTKLPVPCELADSFSTLKLPDFFETTFDVDFEPGGFKLDIIEPNSILNMLIGQPFDIVSFNLPSLDLSLGARFRFGWEDLGFNLNASVVAHVDLGIVYDSTGLERIIDAVHAGATPDYTDILDGFYIRNEEGPELSLGININGGAHVGPFKVFGVTVFEASASGHLNASLGFDVLDPNEDGKLRLDEIFDVTDDFARPENIFCLFDIVGALDAGFEFSATLLGITVDSDDLPFPTNFSISFSLQDILGSAIPGFCAGPDPILGTAIQITDEQSNTTENVLRINAGPFADARIYGDTDDSDNPIYISARTDSRNGDILLSGFGVRDQRYNGNYDRVILTGSEFNDRIDFSGVTNTPLLIRGRAGNDDLKGGHLADVILGGKGHDVIDGREGDDELYGQLGDDLIKGTAGLNLIVGGRGNDDLYGGTDNDTFRFDRRWGNDSVHESLGNGIDDALDFSSVRDNLFIDLNTAQGTVITDLTHTVTHFAQDTEIQVISITGAESGTYTLDWINAASETVTSAPIAYDATADNVGSGDITVQDALRAMDPSLTDINVLTEGDPATELLHTVTFDGLGADAPSLLGDTSNLAGQRPLIGVETTITGTRFEVETIKGGQGADLYTILANGPSGTFLDGSRGSDDYYLRAEDFNGDIGMRDTGAPQPVEGRESTSRRRFDTDRLIIDGRPINETVGLTNAKIFIRASAQPPELAQTITYGIPAQAIEIADATTGFYTLTWNGNVTDALAHDADSVTVERALRTLPGLERALVTTSIDPATGALSHQVVFRGVSGDPEPITAQPDADFDGIITQGDVATEENGLEVIKISLKGGDDTILVQSTPSSSSVDIKGESGSDIISVGVRAQEDPDTGEIIQTSLDMIAQSEITGFLTIDGGPIDTQETQTVTIDDATGGFYSLSWMRPDGEIVTTDLLAHDADADAVQAALRALPDAGLDQVIVTTDDSQQDRLVHTIQFAGVFSDPEELTSNASKLIGDNPTVSHDTLGSEHNTLNIYDTEDLDPNAGRLTSDSIIGLGMDVGIIYSTFAALNLQLGRANDIFTIFTTHISPSTTSLATGQGDDTVFVHTLAGKTTINGEAGNDEINVGERAEIQSVQIENATGGDYTLSYNGAQTAPLAFDADTDAVQAALRTLPGLEGIIVAPIDSVSPPRDNPPEGDGSLTHTVIFRGLRTAPALLESDSSGLAGDDIRIVHEVTDQHRAHTLNGIAHLLTITGGEDNETDGDTLNAYDFDDVGDPDNNNVGDIGLLALDPNDNNRGTLTGLDMVRHGDFTAGINYGQIETMNIDLGSGHERFNIQAALADVTNLDAAAGDDLIVVSSNAFTQDQTTPDVLDDIQTVHGSLDEIRGDLNIQAGQGDNTLYVSDHEDTDPDADVIITASLIAGLAPGDITYQATDGLFNGRGFFPTTIDVTDLEEGMQDFGLGINIYAGSGGNTINVQSTLRGGLRTITRLFTGLGNDNVTVQALHPDSDGMLVIRAESGNDTINAAASNLALLIFGDAGNDTISTGEALANGGTYDDVIFGDRGRIYFLAPTDGDLPTILGGAPDSLILTDANRDGDILAADLIIATPDDGDGADVISSGVGEDAIIGGRDSDTIHAGEGRDVIFGDQGKIDLTLPNNINFRAIFTDEAQYGAGDLIYADGGNDVILGQQGDDTIFGGDGDDDIIGGHNVAAGVDESETNNGHNDYIDGGTGGDFIAADNADIIRRSDTLSPRLRVLIGGTIYDVDLNLAVTTDPQNDPHGFTRRDVTLFDAADPLAHTTGNDHIAGGADNDIIFGQHGDDTLRGDGLVDLSSGNPELLASIDNTTDGDDYIEGNTGQDTIYGDLGQDDLVGGSSTLFSLTDPAQRADGIDWIYGGDGTDTARNTLGDESENGHARDADTIAGDNADILRLVGTNGQPGDFLTFNYDNYTGTLRIIPRGVILHDYAPDGGQANIGDGDIIHGEAGDDVIYAMTGNDNVYGEAQDDIIFGNAGIDWIFAGSGDDAVLGDDGLILTSRNGTPEPLYALQATVEQTLFIFGRNVQVTINIEGRLNRVVDLEPYELGGNDVIFGGLGHDSLHAGAGIDGISGAEALDEFYSDLDNRPTLSYNSRTRKFASYDADNPRQKIEGFFLNFEAEDDQGTKINDGQDYIFGDIGHDWLVGGTNEDRLWGGMGDDMLNADDNHDTNNGANDQPDRSPFDDADFAFGGGGLDVLIANTRPDRLLDWVGEFNSFIVPFSPFGNFTVIRAYTPRLADFLEEISLGDGADPTRVNPDAEPGIVRPSDDEWRDQHGRPRDPQPGNNPGTGVDPIEGPGGGATNDKDLESGNTAGGSQNPLFNTPSYTPQLTSLLPNHALQTSFKSLVKNNTQQSLLLPDSVLLLDILAAPQLLPTSVFLIDLR